MVEVNPGMDGPAGAQSPVDPAIPDDSSLIEDIQILVEDGKTYLEAELQYQKSRVAVAVSYGRSGAVYGVAALAIVHLALVALVVGLVIALTTLVGPWIATVIVVGALVVVAGFLAVAAKRRFGRIGTALREASE